MQEAKNAKVQKILIGDCETILAALKKMDQYDRKLLIVTKDDRFAGLISIGDIQRAIIKDISLDARVKDILRNDIVVARIEDDPKWIRAKMLEERIECMPVIDGQNSLSDVVFWEDIIEGEIKIKEKLALPVVIMAGGEGTRLKPLTNVLPKPLIPVVDKTIIEDIMDQFVRAGCNEFYISLNYKAEMIRHYLENLNCPDYRFHFFQEEKPLGTAGSLYMLTERINSTFFVSNCDIMIKQDLDEVHRYHKENRNKITIIAALKHYKIPYGTIESGADGLLTSLSEKPEITFKINSGVYILEPEILKLIPNGRFFHITDLINRLKQKKERVGIFPISEKSWLDYGLLENLPFINKR
jgi:dTDP-glucose pyrophosphorylase